MATLPRYEVFALRYATVARTARENFIFPVDPHEEAGQLDFFIWAIRDGARSFVVDTGFGEESARKRNRRLLRCPAASLAALGIEAREVRDVIITHLHYDHAGNLDKFPAARFHLQDTEMAFATGRHMGHAAMRHAYEVEDVVRMVRHVYAGRVVFHRGEAELAPGLSLHRIGGHTDGLQVVRVHTARGWVVLASDASHYYANMRRRNPFPIVFDVGAMLEGHGTIERLADGPDHVVPGHDPLVMALYPRVAAAGEVEAVRLDVMPAAAGSSNRLAG